MANLLSWLGNGVKRLENTVNNDVVQPIRRDVVAPVQRDIINPVQQAVSHAPAPIQSAANIATSPFAVPGFIAQSNANALRALAGFATANHVATANGLKGMGQDYNNLANVPRQFVTRPAVQLASSLAPKQLTVRPTNKASRVLLGSTPVQNIEKGVASTYNNHPGLNPVLRAGLAGAYGTGQLAQDIPLATGALKGAKNLKAYDTAQNQIGSVGKNVKLSPDDVKSLQKQGFDQKTISKMAGPQGEKIAAPDVPTRTPGSPKVPKSQGNIIPQLSTEGKVTRFTSLANRLNRLGVGGQGALQTIRDKEIGARIHTQQLADIAKPFHDLNPEQQASAIKVHKGEFTTKDPAVQAGANSLRAMFQEAHQRAINAGVKVGNQGANYFPQSYPREWFKNPKTINKAAQQLVSEGKAPDLETAIGKLNKIKIEGSVNLGTYGHFKPRTTDIPGIENAKTVTNYIRGSSDAIAAAEHFGPKDGVLKGHIANAVRNGEDATAVRDIVSNYLHPKQPGTGAVSRGLSGYQKGLRVLQLPRAAISHGPQGIANTASDIGYKNYFKSMGQKIKMSPEDKRFLNANGFRSEKVAPADGLAGKATAPGLGHLLQFHRDVAALGGRNMALHAAEKGDATALKDMAVSGKLVKDADGKIKLTEAQQAQAGHFEANKSIGSSSRLESPSWAGTDAGKLIGQYRKMYTFKQAERIGNWLTEARHGNPGPLIKYLAIGVPVSGLAVAAAKDEIKNPGSNPVQDKGKLALDTAHNSGVGSIGYGTLDSAINAVSHNYGNDSRWSNAANFVSPGLGFAVQTGQNTAKAAHGNPAPLIREGARLSPVAGTTLANKLAPPTPFVKADNSGSAGTPQQRKANTEAEKKVLNADPSIGNGSYMRQLPNGEYAYWADGDSSPSYTKDKTKAINAIAEATLKASGDSYKIVGNTVYRKGLDGTVTPGPKIKFDYQINGATLTAQKNAGDYTGWLQTAQKQLDNIDKQLKDPNVDPLDQLTLQNEADSLNKQIDKYSGYGGAFTKGSSAAGKIASRKAATAGARSAYKTAVSAKAPAKPKGVSVRKLAAPSFKASGVKKLSVSKIPVVANRRKA